MSDYQDLSHLFQSIPTRGVFVSPPRGGPGTTVSETRSRTFSAGETAHVWLVEDEIGDETIPLHVLEDRGDSILVLNPHAIARYRIRERLVPSPMREHVVAGKTRFLVTKDRVRYVSRGAQQGPAGDHA